MENHHRSKNSSGSRSGSSDVFSFSFPGTPNQDQENEFEFGCVTPDSPNSPADHLFFNGRLLPHVFPIQATTFGSDNWRVTSRTSSVSSKDSLMSSRSNSSSSRSSSCSSARTSSSDNSERKLLYPTKVVVGKTNTKERNQVNNRSVSSTASTQSYGSSKRWQFITPAPVLNPEVSRRKKAEGVKKEGKERTGERSGFGRRFFLSILSACKECHAMEPSVKDYVLQQKIKSHNSL